MAVTKHAAPLRAVGRVREAIERAYFLRTSLHARRASDRSAGEGAAEHPVDGDGRTPPTRLRAHPPPVASGEPAANT